MGTRDKLSTKDNFLSLIKMQTGFIDEWKNDIEKLKDSEKKGVQLYSLPNSEVIQNGYKEILMYEYNNLLATYSAGEDINKILPMYKNIISLMEVAWEKENGYVLLLGIISMGVMLGVDNETFDKLIHIVKENNIKDSLIEYLIQYKEPNWVRETNHFYFNIPYKKIQCILEIYQSNKEEAILRIKKYLTKEWYRGHSDCGWYNIHKINIYAYSGYWSFESGALVKILGLDDSSLKDCPYYPYDMVHWLDNK